MDTAATLAWPFFLRQTVDDSVPVGTGPQRSGHSLAILATTGGLGFVRTVVNIKTGRCPPTPPRRVPPGSRDLSATQTSTRVTSRTSCRSVNMEIVFRRGIVHKNRRGILSDGARRLGRVRSGA